MSTGPKIKFQGHVPTLYYALSDLDFAKGSGKRINYPANAVFKNKSVDSEIKRKINISWDLKIYAFDVKNIFVPM